MSGKAFWSFLLTINNYLQFKRISEKKVSKELNNALQ